MIPRLSYELSPVLHWAEGFMTEAESAQARKAMRRTLGGIDTTDPRQHRAFLSLVGEPSYRRMDLERVLPRHLWSHVEKIGAPNPEGDPDRESLSCSLVAFICVRALREFPDRKPILERAIEKERELGNAFASLGKHYRKFGRSHG